MNKKRCHTLLPLVQLLPTVAVAAAVLFALPRTVPVLAAVPEKLTTVVEQPVEAASSKAEEETLPKLPYADGVYVGSSRGYGGAVRVQVTMENGSITEVEILDASHETKQFLRRAKRLLTTVVETQSWEMDAVSEATYTCRGNSRLCQRQLDRVQDAGGRVGRAGNSIHVGALSLQNGGDDLFCP